MILEQVLGHLEANGITLEAFTSDKVPSIVYEFVNLTSDKIKRQDRLTITTINSDYKQALVTSERLKYLLLTLGDTVSLQGDSFKIELNGGGVLHFEESKTYHIKQIYILKSKERC